MTKTIITILFIGFFFSGFSQEGIDILRPGQTLTNNFGYNIFCMPRSKVEEFMNMDTRAEFDSLRIEKYKELVKTYEERIFLADSATRMRKLEADFWNQKLMANDLLLEDERKKNIQLRADLQDAKRSRLYYFIGGIVATAVVIGVSD